MKTLKRITKSFIIILACQLVTCLAEADELTLYVYPSPLGISWDSPSTLAWSTIANQFAGDQNLYNTHPIGHMNFHLVCDPSSQLPNGADIEAGQTNTDDGTMDDYILKDNYGLGTMLVDYTGIWEAPSDIEHDLPLRYQAGTVAYIDFKISTASCARAVQYLTEYQARNYDLIYGGLERKAREGKGSGCSSFAESVLEITGLMTPEWQKSWSNGAAHGIYVPLNLIGGPITGNSVPVEILLFDPVAFAWNSSATNSFTPFEFWDPWKAFQWIQKAYTNYKPLTGMTYTPSNRNNAKGLEIDATAVPTPTDGFWQP
jgi:hypothetical protein